MYTYFKMTFCCWIFRYFLRTLWNELLHLSARTYIFYYYKIFLVSCTGYLLLYVNVFVIEKV